MIGVNIRGSSFRGAQNYLFAGKVGAVLDPERVAWQAMRNLPVSDPHKAAAVMQATASQNLRVKRPVEHIIINPPPDAQLSRRAMRGIAERTLEDLGLGEHQALIVEHHDLERRHLHILVNRVHPETLRAWDPSFSKRLMNVSLDRQSRELGLPLVRRRETVALHPSEDLSLSLTKGAYHQALRRGHEPFADFVRERARAALLVSSSWDELQGALGKEGLAVEARGAGLVITDGHEVAKASSIDRDASRARIEARVSETFASFRERGGAVSVLPGPALRPSARDASAVSDIPSVRVAAEAMLDRLTRDRAVFTEAELRRYSFWHGKGRDLYAEALGSERLVPLAPSAGTAANADTANGTGIYGPDGADEGQPRRFTTREAIRAEAGLLASADELVRGAAGPTVPNDALELRLRENPRGLSDGEKTALRRLSSDRGLELLSASSGVGKSRLLREAAELYQSQGFRVHGAALSGAGAEALGEAAGVEARTLASLEASWKAGRERLTERDVLLVDEAGRVGTRQLSGVLEEARAAGAKVILSGDVNQLRPVEAGEPFRGLLAEHGGAHLETIRRQRLPWQAEASRSLAEGRTAEALTAYAEGDRVRWQASKAEAIEELVKDYRAAAREHPGDRRLVLAHTKADTAALNSALRSAQRAAGELGEDVALPSGRLAAGDRLRFDVSDRFGRDVRNVDAGGARLGVPRGAVGTVREVSTDRVEVALDGGRRVEFDPAKYQGFAYGYATTVSQAAVSSTERAFVLADPRMEASSAYVALTRHSEDAVLYTSRQQFRSAGNLVGRLSRDRGLDLVSSFDPDAVRALREELRPEPRAVARAETAVRLPTPSPAPTPPPAPSVADRGEALVEKLSVSQGVFSSQDLEILAGRERQGPTEAAAALASNRLVELRTDEAGRVLYTTADYLEAESRLFGAAERLTGAEAGARVPEEGREAHLAENRHTLSDEQKAAVRRLTSERGLELLSGRAGTGKSRLFREVADLYEAEGFRVRGAALSGAAAENLGQAAGIEARTLASLEVSWKAGRERLTERDVLIVDEAGMVGTRQLAGVLEEAQAAGAKVILAGDENQLRPIEAGEPFRGLLAEHGGAHLGTIRRQRLAWQAEASTDLAEGRTAEALAAYGNAGRIEWYPDRRAALDDLVLRYREDSLARPEETRLALAYRREDAAHLNEEIRAGRKELGQLGEDVSVGGKPYAVGDRILFLRNDHQGREVETVIPTTDGARGVRNGTFATVESISPTRIEARLDTGRRVAFNPETYASFGYGYAATVHKAQGATVDRAYFVPDRLIERDAAYVALTRHARDLSLHVDRASFATERELQTSLAREPLRDLARDHRSVAEIERVAGQLARRRELEAALSEVAEGRYRVERSVDELARFEARARAHQTQFRASLAAVYRDPRAAEAALVAAVEQHGSQRAAEILRSEPQRFGRLPGRGGILPSGARREAVEASRSAAHHLTQWAATREPLAAAAAAVARTNAPAREKTLFQKGRALRGNISVARSTKAFAKELGSLPSEEALGKTASRALRMVGFAAVAQAVPTAVYLSALAASSAYRMVRDIGRGKGLGRGPSRR